MGWGAGNEGQKETFSGSNRIKNFSISREKLTRVRRYNLHTNNKIRNKFSVDYISRYSFFKSNFCEELNYQLNARNGKLMVEPLINVGEISTPFFSTFCRNVNVYRLRSCEQKLNECKKSGMNPEGGIVKEAVGPPPPVVLSAKVNFGHANFQKIQLKFFSLKMNKTCVDHIF